MSRGRTNGLARVRALACFCGLTSLLFTGISSAQDSPASDHIPGEEAELNTATEPAQEIVSQEENESDEVHPFSSAWLPEVHGFVSQGFIKTSQNNYLTQSKRGSFEFTEIGLNFTKQITDNFRVGMQLFMRDLGPLGNYKPQFDWGYLDYRFFDWLGLRAGRTKIPFGLYNEINDIDAARVPILLPQAVYSVENRDFLLAQTGFEAYGRIPLSQAGALEYQIYGGTIFVDMSHADEAENFDVPYVFGGRAMWETPLDGLRAGGTFQSLRFDYDLILPPEQRQSLIDVGLLPADAGNSLDMDFPVRLWVTSIEYAAHDLLLAAEYGRWKAELGSKMAPALTVARENERFYVMGNYRVAPWFTPGAYYSLLYPDVTNRSGRENQQHDLALTLRFDPIDYLIVKAEGHFMSGTAYLNADLNGGIPPSELTRNWSLFMLKTTGYF